MEEEEEERERDCKQSKHQMVIVTISLITTKFLATHTPDKLFITQTAQMC